MKNLNDIQQSAGKDGGHDGLMDRWSLVSSVNVAIAHCHRDSSRGYALLRIEFEGFHRMNNSLGHEASVEFVRQAGNRLRELSEPLIADDSERTFVAALGAGAFAVFFDGAVDPFTAVEAAGRIVQQMEQPFEVANSRIASAVNIGIVVSGMGHGDGEEVMRDAGLAMCEARKSGRGAYVVFDLAMHFRAHRRLELEMDIRQAIERRQFELFYQPIVDLSTDRLRGFEALVRWRHPKRGLVMPGEFIQVAEETGLIVPLGNFVARQAMSQLSAWRETFPESPDLAMNINLSLAQLSRPDLTETIGAALAASGLPPKSVCLEVTESMLMHDKAAALWALRELRGLGVQLATDDFGTGHSSLACLHEFPLDILKIDRAFIGRMTQNAPAEAVVKAILSIARSYGLHVTAEGIEQQQQVSMLTQFGCQYGQGYHFGRPMSANAAAAFIADSVGKMVLPGAMDRVTSPAMVCRV